LEVIAREVVVVHTVASRSKCLHPKVEEYLVPWPIDSSTLISDDGLEYREIISYAKPSLFLRTVLNSRITLLEKLPWICSLPHPHNYIMLPAWVSSGQYTSEQHLSYAKYIRTHKH